MNNQIYTPKQDYKVLTFCATYNQSKYIEDALNGFAMQKTNFPFVCLVMDDCSTDEEQEVIKTWMERECDMTKAEHADIELSNVILVPHKNNKSCMFAFYLLKKNMYGAPEKRQLITPWQEHCEYEALCEGDDYWIAEDKLQKQVDFLDTNKNYSCCLTRYICYNQQKQCVYAVCGESRETTREMLLKDFQFGTCTILFRVSFIFDYQREIQPFSGGWLMGDKPLLLYLGVKGNVHTLPLCMATYRILENTASHSNDIVLQLKRARNTIDIYQFFANKYFPGDVKLTNTIEGGYLYRAYLLYKQKGDGYPQELVCLINDYHCGYWKLYIVKVLIKIPLLEHLLYKLSEFKNYIFTIIRK